jgi:hypothetical protein
VLGFVYVVFGGEREAATNGAEARVARGLLAVFGLAAVLALAPAMTDPLWRLLDDNLFHAAFANGVANHGVPPLDPYFASLPLTRAYFYDVTLAGTSALSAIEPFGAAALLDAVALLGLVFGFGYLASFFSQRVWPRVLGGVLVTFGVSGWGFAFEGERWSETSVLQIFSAGGAAPLALAPVCVVLGLMISARRGCWSDAHATAFVLSVAGVLYFEPIAGIVVAVATLALIVFLMAIHSHTDGDGPSYASLAALCLLGAALAAPYVYAAHPRDVGFAFRGGEALGVVSRLLPVLVLSVPFLAWVGKDDEWRTVAGSRETALAPGETPAPPGGVVMGRLFGELSLSPAGILAMWTLFALVAALAIEASDANLLFVAFLPLAAFATGGINRAWETRRGRVLAVAIVLSATVPPVAAGLQRRAVGLEMGGDERATYRWIERSSPESAVFLDGGNTARLPALAARDLYFGGEALARKHGHPAADMRRRRDVRDAFFSNAGPAPAHFEALAELDRPVWVLCRETQGAGFETFERIREDSRFRGRFVAGGLGVFEVDFVDFAREAAAADTAVTPDAR